MLGVVGIFCVSFWGQVPGKVCFFKKNMPFFVVEKWFGHLGSLFGQFLLEFRRLRTFGSGLWTILLGGSVI